jgi:hypothetical protein
MLLAGTLAFGGLAAQESFAGTPTRSVCAPKAGGAVAADRYGQLWVQGADQTEMWGCLYGHHPHDFYRFLGGSGWAFMNPLVSGKVAAFGAAQSSSDGPNYDDVVVVNLATGQRMKRLADGYGLGGDGQLESMVLKPDGAVAWIAPTGYMDSINQVYVDDATGYRMLASGMSIAGGSLALAGSTIYWLQGGVAQSATLR